MALKTVFDPNAYCSGHITGAGDNPRVAAFPDSFSAEALALGARTTGTANGFVSVNYLFDDPASLYNLPRIDEQPAIRAILADIERRPPGKIALLKANGAWSVLASLVEPALLYRWIRKERGALHAALARINAGLTGYIRAAFDWGVQILSLADPFANPALLGENHCREFAAEYLITLLRDVCGGESAGNEGAGGTGKSPGAAQGTGRRIHLCPHSSLTLEKLNLVHSRKIPLGEHQTCTGYLAMAPKTGAAVITGHQCIYAENIGEIIELEPAPPSRKARGNNFL
jgi:hypothetical protein